MPVTAGCSCSSGLVQRQVHHLVKVARLRSVHTRASQKEGEKWAADAAAQFEQQLQRQQSRRQQRSRRQQQCRRQQQERQRQNAAVAAIAKDVADIEAAFHSFEERVDQRFKCLEERMDKQSANFKTEITAATGFISAVITLCYFLKQ